MTGLSRADMEAVFLESRRELERSVRRRLSSPDLAPDIVHDVYLRWTRVDPIFPNRAEARAYLFRMVANLAIDRQKVEARRQEILVAAKPFNSALVGNPESENPESSALAADHAKHIEEALKELPKRDADPVASIRNSPALRQHDLRFTQLADDLLGLLLPGHSIPPS